MDFKETLDALYGMSGHRVIGNLDASGGVAGTYFEGVLEPPCLSGGPPARTFVLRFAGESDFHVRVDRDGFEGAEPVEEGIRVRTAAGSLWLFTFRETLRSPGRPLASGDGTEAEHKRAQGGYAERVDRREALSEGPTDADSAERKAADEESPASPQPPGLEEVQPQDVEAVVEKLSSYDRSRDISTLEESLRLALEASTDDFWLWEEAAEASGFVDEFSVPLEKVAQLSPAWRAAYIARLLRTMALVYGVGTQFGGRLGEPQRDGTVCDLLADLRHLMSSPSGGGRTMTQRGHHLPPERAIAVVRLVMRSS